jgi:hypothetical protein
MGVVTASKISATVGLPQANPRAERKLWSPPRVILSAVGDDTLAAHSNTSADQIVNGNTPQGS